MLSFNATVVQGEGRGKKLGFPTANLAVSKLSIGFGVYAVEAKIGEGYFKGVMHYGPRKTFDNMITAEVHLIGFSGDLYGTELEVSVKRRIRKIERFEDIEALKSRIEKDIEIVRADQREK